MYNSIYMLQFQGPGTVDAGTLFIIKPRQYAKDKDTDSMM